MSPLDAWLYLDRIEFSRYWPENAELKWDDFYSQFEGGRISVNDCEFLSVQKKQALSLALDASSYLPVVPTVDIPRPITSELVGLNDPDEHSPVLVTANNRFTFEVISTVWSQGITPAWFLLLNCGGNTLDMALVFNKFTPQALEESIKTARLASFVSHRNLLMPGLASTLKDEFESATEWKTEIGPVCAAEIPLFLAERWIFP